jgi:hypothetical protein
MADDQKRSNNLCSKVTDLMLIEVGRICAIEDVTQSDYLYRLIRRDLFGRSLRSSEIADRITSANPEN